MDLKKMNEDREKMLQEMMENGQLGIMTECAYGATIANAEETNKLNFKKKEEEKSTNK